MGRRSLLTVAATLATILTLVAWPASADDYSNTDYAQHDADNMSRSSTRQPYELTTPEYFIPMTEMAVQTWLEDQGRQFADIDSGRLRLSLGQLLPGGDVGDPRTFDEFTPRHVVFLARTGAKLEGDVWGGDAPGPRPGVVITTGSIQAPGIGVLVGGAVPSRPPATS